MWGINLLTAEESRSFPLQNVAQEVDEVVLTNEINSDFEGKPRSSPKQRRKRPRGRQDLQPRKKRRIDEAVVAEKRLQRTAPIAMRSSDFRARSKMKVRRLILEKDSSPESRSTARKECHGQEARSAEKSAREKKESIRKKTYLTEDWSTSVEQPRASKKDKGKAILTEDVPLRRKDAPVGSTRTKEPQDQAAEVLTVFSDTEEDPVALEEVAAKAVEDVAAAESGPQKVTSPRTSTDTVILETGEEPSGDETQSPVLGAADVLSVQVLPLLKYLDQKREKCAEGSPNESYVKIVRNRTQIKVELAAEVAAKE
ncbi:hypothetical protein AXG93_3661s1170 [Marchantia polymorpha subsp. ruderalis]|uniref:Uncharacterized protein n=1 Tax=Marchantia polymorpha subsp. ruderalis TaxID=1480154 RepID=A0A176VL94_MARPO|nr:hypothetical protein AXG93_3661s1170 [Marchantia polymorpha subsp. ruderalis]